MAFPTGPFRSSNSRLPRKSFAAHLHGRSNSLIIKNLGRGRGWTAWTNTHFLPHSYRLGRVDQTYMSDQPRVVAATGIAICSASTVGGAAATFVLTGRHIDGRDKYWSQVPAWAQLDDLAAIESHPLTEEFWTALAGAQVCLGDQLTCYRGHCPEQSVPSATDMGPAPLGQDVRHGRYNYNGQVVLYLSQSLQGVALEMKQPQERAPQNTAYTQSYTLDLNRLRIADFRLPDDTLLNHVDSLLNHVFYWTELLNPQNDDKFVFVFSQFVASCVADLFDGMFVPGVRGDRSVRYANVVVFRPHEHELWKDCLTPGCGPQRMSQ